MLYQIVALLLEIAAGLLCGACLLRLYMQLQRVPFGNPIGRLVFALSDWLVLPLRRVIPNAGRWDMSSLLGAFLVKLVHYGVLWLFSGGSLLVIPVMALFGMLGIAIQGLTMLVIVYAVLSWVQPHSPLADVLDRLLAPLLRPLRRVIPLVGGMDLSPLALLVLLQIASIVLQHALPGALSTVV